MSTKSICFRIDEELKNEADSILSDIGLNMTSALTMFLKQVVNKHTIPFVLETSDSFYSVDNQIKLEERLKEYNHGKYSEHELIEVD